jgi:hypothetical protein
LFASIIWLIWASGSATCSSVANDLVSLFSVTVSLQDTSTRKIKMQDNFKAEIFIVQIKHPELPVLVEILKISPI